jgi:hypothetical protein
MEVKGCRAVRANWKAELLLLEDYSESELTEAGTLVLSGELAVAAPPLLLLLARSSTGLRSYPVAPIPTGTGLSFELKIDSVYER